MRKILCLISAFSDDGGEVNGGGGDVSGGGVVSGGGGEVGCGDGGHSGSMGGTPPKK